MLCLNIGCGKACRKSTKDCYWINIDLFEGQEDLFKELKESGFNVIQSNVIDLQNCYKNVDEIHAYHLIEHLTLKDAVKGLIEWKSVLKDGGKLVLELPDLRKACQRYLKDEGWATSIFGANRFPGDQHQWGYSRKEIRRILKKIGFKEIKIMNGTDYHTKYKNVKPSDFMRVEAIK